METTSQSFIAGFFDGRKYKRFQSPREVMESHPSLSRELADVFLNGQQDGINGDRFRLDLIRSKF
jgi:hypothetical protein